MKKITKEIYAANYDKHRVETPFEKLTYKNPHAWIIEEGSAKKYINPVPFRSKKGAIVWINLSGQCDVEKLLEESSRV